jgi:NADH:ubiquinone oxidoreductase subunit 5 (subunit L)/multisubunit Na+/H+ antiporter MnhA subunit
MFAITTFSIPILGSFATLIADRYSEKLRNALAVIVMVATVLSALIILPQASQGNVLVLTPFSVIGFSLSFIVDWLGVFLAIMSSVIGLLIVCYSLGYMRDYAHQGEYYFLVVLFLGAMMGLVISANLLLIYVFWEITAICSWRLIGFFRDPEHLRNADTALMMTVFGSFFMLVGIEMVWRDTGTLIVPDIRGHAVSNLALFFIFLGILAKSAQVPLQVWLPAAGVAPSPVTALLHAAVLVIIGVFAFARIFVGAFLLPLNWQVATSAVAVATILVAGASALIEKNAKRILAYSTLGQLGYVYLGLASMTSIGIAGGIVFLLAHSIAKAGLFLCVGIIEHRTHTRNIDELGGLIRTMPLTAAAFIVCGLTIIGFPPTAGFYGKLMIIMGAFESGKTLFALLAVLGGVVTLVYMLRLFSVLFLGREHHPDVQEGTQIMLATVIIFAVLSLLIGLAGRPLLDIVQALVAQMTG